MSRRPNRAELLAAFAHLRAELRGSRAENHRLRSENAILREAAQPLIHEAAARERFVFIHARRDRFSARRLCNVLLTDRCNYLAWVPAENGRGRRELDQEELARRIAEIHATQPAYGVLRITRELQRRGVPVGRRVVTRLMRAQGIAGVTRRRRRSLTKPDPGAAAVADLIGRQFTAPMPGLELIGDISCFPTAEGWLYLATVLDLCTKELIGYATAPHMRASLAVDAVVKAHRTGLVAGNAIPHTGRGSQYHAKAHRNVLRRLDMRQSTGRTGSCLDGAAAESFFATMKAEIGTSGWSDRATARRDIENWIISYNERRLHSSIGYQSPMKARIAWQERMTAAA